MTGCVGQGTGDRAHPRAAADAIIMVVDGPLRRTDVPGLCARARRLLAGGANVLVCDVSNVAEADLGTVDALARVRLTATRLGRQLRLRDPSANLRGLLVFTGLGDPFPPTRRTGVAEVGQTGADRLEAGGSGA